jgi:hypothetical protein
MPTRTIIRTMGVLLPALLAFTSVTRAEAPPAKSMSVDKIAYQGWPEAYRLSNGTVDVVVVPAVGRIMRFGPVGGANLLWENPKLAGHPASPGKEWANFGGDKVWPWPQDDWPQRAGRAWPPPVAADQAAHTVEPRGDSIRMTSPVIEGYGVRIVRDVRLEPTGTRLTIDSRLENAEKPADFAIAAWTVTQFPRPDQLFARVLPDSTLKDGYRPLSDEKWQGVRALEGGRVFVAGPQSKGVKLGFDADLLAWRKGPDLVIGRASFPDSDASPKPAERGQMWNNTDPAYIELEFTAPLAVPAKQKLPTLRTTWEWQQIPADETPEAMARRLMR